MENLAPLINDNSILRNISNNFGNCLKIGHINIHSLCPSARRSKFEEFKSIIEHSGLDIMAVSEI